MKFENALSALRDGKQVKRTSWFRRTLLISKNYDMLMETSPYLSPNGDQYRVIAQLSGQDILADDWEVE